MGIIGWIVLIGALWYFFGGGGRRSGCLTNIIVGLVVLWIFDHFSVSLMFGSNSLILASISATFGAIAARFCSIDILTSQTKWGTQKL